MGRAGVAVGRAEALALFLDDRMMMGRGRGGGRVEAGALFFLSGAGRRAGALSFLSGARRRAVVMRAGRGRAGPPEVAPSRGPVGMGRGESGMRRPGSIRASLLLSSLRRAPGPCLLALLAGAGAGPGTVAEAAAAGAGGAGAGGVGGAGGAAWVPGPLSCRLDCRPPLLGAWSACPAITIFRETVRSPSLSPSLEMFMMAVLQLRRSLR